MGRLHIAEEKKVVPIRLHIPYQYQVDPMLLSTIFITNREGKKIPLSELTQVVNDAQDRPILHKDFERVTYVGAELTDTTPVNAVMDIDQRLDGLSIGDGEKLTRMQICFCVFNVEMKRNL